MAILLVQAVQVIAVLAIVVSGYKTVQLVLEAKSSNKFVLKSFFQNKEEAKLQIKEQIGLIERYTSFNKYKRYLEMKLQEARLETPVNRFILQCVLMSVSILIVMLFMYSFTHLKLYIYLAIPLAIFGYMIPNRIVKKNLAYYEQQMKIQLPEYLSNFAILLSTYTPFEATRRSVEYAGSILKPLVEQMVQDIELSPSSTKPYEKFAAAVGLREAREFVVALQQIMKVDSKNSQKIIEDQITIMEQLIEEAENEQIIARPDKVHYYIMPMLFTMVAIIFTFVFVMLADSFSNLY
ncbi:hypothetical protein [Bacillus sp. 1P06AnD]|uniref:hypothetical protein n=1 Tax=Bacillus sp. 1P06AnD TaxID=3132208 RepID=UPI0039A110B0